MERKPYLNQENERLRNFAVIKFGGSSVKDSQNINNCMETALRGNFKVVVVSAPGETTNWLRGIIEDPLAGENYKGIYKTYLEIQSNLGLPDTGLVDDCLYELNRRLNAGDRDSILAWGEWSMAQIFAAKLGGEFVDAAEILKVKECGDERIIDGRSVALVRSKIEQSRTPFVFPGFYGSDVDSGEVITLNFGGSDYTGVFIASCLETGLVKSTDVKGLLDDRGLPLGNASYSELEKFDTNAKLINKQARDFAISTNTLIWIKSSRDANLPGTIIGLMI